MIGDSGFHGSTVELLVRKYFHAIVCLCKALSPSSEPTIGILETGFKPRRPESEIDHCVDTGYLYIKHCLEVRTGPWGSTLF